MNLLTPILLLLTSSGGTGGGFWFPESASTVAPDVDRVFNWITYISIFFFVLIVGGGGPGTRACASTGDADIR